jgi:hypothetical protein
MSRQADKTSLSLAGEHLVAAQLCLQGHIASMTLKNFPGVDILAYDTSHEKTVNLQVKSIKKTTGFYQLGVKAAYDTLDKELEERIKLPHIFVAFEGEDVRKAQVYVTPPKEVRAMARGVYMRWIEESRHRKPVDELKRNVQPLGIPLKDLSGFKDRWDLLWEKQNSS